MRCAMQISKGKECEKIEKLNMESLEDPTTQYLYQRRLQEKIQDNPIRGEDDVESAWKKLSSSMVNAVREAVGKRTINVNGRKSSKP